MPSDERDALQAIDRETRPVDSSPALSGLDGSAADRATPHGEKSLIHRGISGSEPDGIVGAWAAERAAFLIDGEAYYPPFAGRLFPLSVPSIFWDGISTRVSHEGRTVDGYPDRLGPFLNASSCGEKYIFMSWSGTSTSSISMSGSGGFPTFLAQQRLHLEGRHAPRRSLSTSKSGGHG